MAGSEEEMLTANQTETQAENESEELKNTETEKQERIIKLPLTRIKHIIKMDPDVTLASQDAVIMIAKAVELFVQDLSKHAYNQTSQTKRKTVQKKDLDHAVDHVDSLAFLEGTLDS